MVVVRFFCSTQGACFKNKMSLIFPTKYTNYSHNLKFKNGKLYTRDMSLIHCARKTESKNKSDKSQLVASLNSNTKDITNGTGTDYPSGTPEFNPGFYWFSFYLFIVLSNFVCLFVLFALAIVLSLLSIFWLLL